MAKKLKSVELFLGLANAIDIAATPVEEVERENKISHSLQIADRFSSNLLAKQEE